MGGIFDRMIGNRPRPETLRAGERRETPVESFIRRSGGNFENVTAARQLLPEDEQSQLDEQKRFKERRKKLLDADTGPDVGTGGFASTINKIGSNLLGGPSVAGVPVNPLRLITNGFHLSQKYMAEPVAGLVVGGFVGGLSSITPGLRDTRFGDVGRDFYENVVFEGGNFWTNSGDFQRSRDSLFWGEKFISTMVADPLNFMGFGLLGKIPVVGRTALKGRFFNQRMEFSLGGIENGYVAAVNLPFKKAGWALKRFGSATRLTETKAGKNFGKIKSRSRNQLVADAGARASDVIRRAYTVAAKQKSPDAVSDEELLQFAAEAMNMSTPYGQLATREHKQFRDLMLDADPISRAGVQGIAKAAGSDLPRIHRHQRFAINNMVELAVRGRASVEEVSNRIIRLVGGDPQLTKTRIKVESAIEAQIKRRFKHVEESLTKVTPNGLERSLLNKTMKITRNKIDERFHEWTDDMGKIGGIIRGFDNAQTVVWQNGIQRFLSRPLATAILKTPEYLVSNITEDGVRVITGRSSFVYRGVDEISVDFAGYSVYSRGLFQQQNPGANRLGLYDDYKEARDLGLTDLIPGWKGFKLKIKGKEFEGIGGKESIVNAGRLLGDKWFESANAMASGMRRGYFTERSYKRLSEMFQDEIYTQALARELGSLPEVLANSDYGAIVKTATIRAGRGDGDAVRVLKEELTKERIDLKNSIKIIDTMATSGGLIPEARSIWYDWAQKGGDLSLIDDLAKRTDRLQFEHFMNSPERAGIQLEALLASIKDVDTNNATEKLSALAALDDVMKDIMQIPHRIQRNVTRRITRGEYGNAAKFDLTTKQALHEAADESMTELFNVVDDKFDDIMDAAMRLTDQEPHWAELHRQRFNAMRDARESRNRSIQDLMSSTNDRSSYFWEVAFDDAVKEHWEILEATESGMKDLNKQAWRNVGARIGNATDTSLRPLPVSSAMKNIFEEGKDFAEHELSKIIGGDVGQIQQAIVGDAALGKEQFIERVLKQASEVGADVPEVARAKIGRVYDEVLSSLGIDESVHSAMSAREETIASLKQQLIENKIASKFTPELKSDLDDYLERVAGAVDHLSPTARVHMRRMSEKAVGEAVNDLKAAFVNYDDQTMLDAFMASIFPFWTYESRRIPYLARVGMQNPVTWKSFGPEGYYWENTDNGYVRADVLGMGTEFNLIGGTAFNAPRRMFRAEFPTQHDGGVLGQYASVEESIARFGFYPGPHVKMLTSGVLPKVTPGAEPETGEFLPTSYANVINLAGGAAQLPGLEKALSPISDPINTIRDTVFGDRFRERQVLKELWAMGLPSDQIDITTMRPRAGSIVTQEDMREAMRRASVKEALTGFVGKVRFRSDDETRLRDAVAEVYEVAGLPRDMQEKALKAGVPRSSLVPLSPSQQEVLNNLPGADEYRALNGVLRSPQAKVMAEKTSRMWESYTAQVEAIDAQQRELDERWLRGDVAPVDYRELTKGWSTRRASVLPNLRGRIRIRNAEGQLVDTPMDKIDVVNPVTGEVKTTRGGESADYWDVPITPEEHLAMKRRLGRDDFQPLRHELDELLEDYRSFVPEDMDGDGRPEWSTFFRSREEFVKNLPEDVREEFMAALDRSEEIAPGIPSPQRILRDLSETRLGEYWAIDERIQEELGVEKLVAYRTRARRIGDENDMRFYRLNPLLRMYDRRIRQERERVRQQDPMIDYALNVFGFTGSTLSFKNPIARDWWRSNGNAPDLGRFETFQTRS